MPCSVHPHKGPGNGRDNFQNTVGAHVVAAGSVTLSESASPVDSQVVTLPKALQFSESQYAVIATSSVSNPIVTNPIVTNRTDENDGFKSFTISGEGNIDWVVIKKGL